MPGQLPVSERSQAPAQRAGCDQHIVLFAAANSADKWRQPNGLPQVRQMAAWRERLFIRTALKEIMHRMPPLLQLIPQVPENAMDLHRVQVMLVCDKQQFHNIPS